MSSSAQIPGWDGVLNDNKLVKCWNMASALWYLNEYDADSGQQLLFKQGPDTRDE